MGAALRLKGQLRACAGSAAGSDFARRDTAPLGLHAARSGAAPRIHGGAARCSTLPSLVPCETWNQVTHATC